MNNQIDVTTRPSNNIEFAPWPTIVEADDLHLVELRYANGAPKIDFPNDGFSLEMQDGAVGDRCDLEAVFFAREKRAAVVFSFESVSAFRVLDEHGLIDMWHASATSPRPTSTTFKVRGHGWQAESPLSWEMFDCEFSHMIATGWDCLEVVTTCEPKVELIPAIVVEHASSGRR